MSAFFPVRKTFTFPKLCTTPLALLVHSAQNQPAIVYASVVQDNVAVMVDFKVVHLVCAKVID
jgi:hypothetical protein